MPRRKLNYREGDWFAVPLEDSGYALGLVARSPRKGKVLLGYFFGPRRETVPTEADTCGLRARDAIHVEMFGDLGLLNGSWPVIGHSDPWDRACWPLPSFVRVDRFTGRARLILYSENELEEIGETPCDPTVVDQFPEDGLAGYGAVEIGLTMLLSGHHLPKPSRWLRSGKDCSNEQDRAQI